MNIKDFDKVRELHNKVYNLELYLQKLDKTKLEGVHVHFHEGHICAGISENHEIKLDPPTLTVINDLVIQAVNYQIEDAMKAMVKLGVVIEGMS